MVEYGMENDVESRDIYGLCSDPLPKYLQPGNYVGPYFKPIPFKTPMGPSKHISPFHYVTVYSGHMSMRV